MKRDITFEELDLKGSKQRRAPLLCSTRLNLFVILCLATCNFVVQRFSINFAIVCMHRPIPFTFQSPGTAAAAHVLLNNSHSENFPSSLEANSLVHEADNKVGASDEVLKVPTAATGASSATHSWECGEGRVKRVKEGNGSSEGQHSSFLTEFSWSKETKGGIIASFYYGLTFSQLPGGYIVDRFGAKNAILLSQFFLSVLSMLNPISAQFGPEYMFVARLLQGVANGAAMSSISALGARWCSSMERSFLLGIAYAGFGIATAVVYPISGFLCEHFGWDSIFYFGGGTGLLWVVVALFLVYEWPENHPRISGTELQFIQKHRAVQYGGKKQVIRTPWKSMLLSVPVWAVIVANFCTFWCFLTISAYLPTYLTEVLALDISENGLLSSLPFVGMMTFHFVVAVIFDWLRKKQFCSVIALRKFFNTLGMFGSALSMVAIGFLPCDSIIGSVMLFTLCQTFLEFPLMAGYLFSMFEIAPRYASSLTSLSNTFGLLTGLISPTVVAWLTPMGTRAEWLNVFYVSAGINVFGGLVYLFFGQCKLQPWASGSGNCSTVGDGCSDHQLSLSLSRSSSTKKKLVLEEQELKNLKIRLINGESDVKGQTVAP